MLLCWFVTPHLQGAFDLPNWLAGTHLELMDREDDYQIKPLAIKSSGRRDVFSQKINNRGTSPLKFRGRNKSEKKNQEKKMQEK